MSHIDFITDDEYPRGTTYLGNTNIKKSGVQEQWTIEKIQEYKKCSEDPVYFIEKYMKIINLDEGLIPFKLWDFQKELITHIDQNRFSCILAARQSSKSTTMIGYLLWYSLFKPEQTVVLLANKGDTAREIFSRFVLALENIPFFLQPGTKVLNRGSIEFANNTKVYARATSSSSIRGLSCVPDYTKVTIIDDFGGIYHNEIAKVINNNSEFIKGKHMNCKNAKKYYTVYKTTNKNNGKEYIGFHSTNDLDDGYLGSGKLLKKAIEKYGIDSFEKEYLAIFDNREDAENLERELVNKDHILREDNYNISIGGNVCILYGELNGFFGKSHSDETRNVISEIRQGQESSEETKQKISDSLKEKWLQSGYKEKLIESLKERWSRPEYKEKLSESMKRANAEMSEEKKQQKSENLSKALSGIEFTEEHKKNISISRKQFFENMSEEEYNIWYEQHFNEEIRKKMSDSLKGKKKSEEWVNKINKNPVKIEKTAAKHRGSKRSLESKKKMSDAAKNREPNNKDKIYCYNPETLEKKLCFPHEMPEGWIRGFVKKNGNTDSKGV